MLIIGLVGGVACGKSTVAANFQSLGACVVDGDRAGHAALGLPSVRRALVAQFGEQILDASRGLDRGKIAQIVFGPEPSHRAALAVLESITHPEIEAMLRLRISEVTADGFPAAVVDAAVMMKTGWDKLCDKIAYIDAPEALRLQRAILRGMTREQFRAREQAQTPLDVKRARADAVIDNSGTPQQTFQEVQQVWHSWVRIA
jgi:dephospho-CoA kinase